jgi:hypothetical protein
MTIETKNSVYSVEKRPDGMLAVTKMAQVKEVPRPLLQVGGTYICTSMRYHSNTKCMAFDTPSGERWTTSEVQRFL